MSMKRLINRLEESSGSGKGYRYNLEPFDYLNSDLRREVDGLRRAAQNHQWEPDIVERHNAIKAVIEAIDDLSPMVADFSNVAGWDDEDPKTIFYGDLYINLLAWKEQLKKAIKSTDEEPVIKFWNKRAVELADEASDIFGR